MHKNKLITKYKCFNVYIISEVDDIFQNLNVLKKITIAILKINYLNLYIFYVNILISVIKNNLMLP